MPRRSNRQPPRPFRCRSCGLPLASHEVSGAQQMRTVDGKPRLHAHVRCNRPVREWWSRNFFALQRSREVDAMNRAGGEASE